MLTRSNVPHDPSLPAESSTIRALFLAPLVHALESSGVPVDSFLRIYGLSAAQLTSLYERVPLHQFVALAEAAAERLDRPFLGLELGGRFAMADLGPFYALFILQRDLRAALLRLSRFQAAWQTNTLLSILPGSSSSACRYRIQDPSIWPRRQDAEFALASFTMFVRHLTDKRWRPLEVEFEHDVTGRVAALRGFFNAPVRGNCAANQLIIANADLETPLRWRLEAGEEDVAPILERHLMELLRPGEKRVPDSAAKRVDALVDRRLGRAKVTIEAIASDLNISVRSLRRHLAEEGTSFRQILQARRRVAIEAILSTNGARLSGLASRMSYSDSAVLSRAFKSWTGLSPRAYARSQRHG